MIYICMQLTSAAQELEPQLLAQVPEVHKPRIFRYKREEDRLRSLLCWHLLCMGWRQEFGEPLPEIVRKKNGKLYVQEQAYTDDGRYFNFSHCNTGVCCAIGSRELGVDMQNIRTVTHTLQTRCCSAQELAWLAQAEERGQKEQLFALLWSRKEAMGKMDGRGITLDLRTLGWMEDGRLEIPSGMGTEQNFDHSDQASELLHGRSWYLTENTALAICYRGERQTHMEQLVQVSLHDMLYSGEC